MSLTDTHPFDRDTALEPLAEGLWRGRIDERWWIIAGPYGGYVATFFTRALMELAPGRAPRSLTIHFLEAPAAGEVEIAGTVERLGGATTSASLRMTQQGRTVAVALASSAQWREGEAEWRHVAMPDVPGPEDCVEVRQSSSSPPFHSNFDIRFAEGGSPLKASERPYNAAWMRYRPGRELDHLALTGIADGWMPAAFSGLGRVAFVLTVDLTLHFRVPLPHPGEWVLTTISSRFGAGGAWDQDVDVWAADGTLLVSSRQLALIRG
jgi:acyl-CoA thioesterase